jgi:hypothetical protein
MVDVAIEKGPTLPRIGASIVGSGSCTWKKEPDVSPCSVTEVAITVAILTQKNYFWKMRLQRNIIF